MFRVVDSSNRQVTNETFPNREEAKVLRDKDAKKAKSRFVVRTENHPRGASKIAGGLFYKAGEQTLKLDKEGNPINVAIRLN